MMVEGSFDIDLKPLAVPANGLAAMGIAKRYHGALSATGYGQMLASHGHVAGSAGYVAMETVEGTLDGRTGSFVLQHFGTMQGGTEHLQVQVVPDSGTGELRGISGKMQILRDGGQHRYRFECTL